MRRSLTPPHRRGSGNRLKVVLSILFVLLVAFFVARGFWNIEVKVTPKKAAIKTAVKKKAPPKPVKKKAAVAVSTVRGAKMAIILDDWGHNLALAQEAVAIGRPLTLSILPHLSHSAAVAEEAKRHGLGVMLHMPMEPKGLRAAREPKTITTSTTDAGITALLDEALASVPQAEGVNNHQGSAATSDERVMRAVMSHVMKRGLFFVDSRVVASSICEPVAEALGIRFASRDIFIDNLPVSGAIKIQLRKAQKIALTTGSVVVIGHDKKVTLDAIRDFVPELEKNGVRLVLVEDLVL